MTEEIEPEASRESREFKRFLEEFDAQGFVAGGAVPEGHEGTYTPTSGELRTALLDTYDAALQTAQARREAAERLVDRLREQQEEAQ
jgi:hypothetical protein